VPADFAFAVKAPREITHDLRLADADAALAAFLDSAAGLGGKLGVLLFQFPPSFAFDAESVGTFFAAVRGRHHGNVVCEPRHASWFTPRAEALLIEHKIARVAADPAVVPAAAEPGGSPDLQYFRLHGSPRMYRSAYEPDQIARYAERLQQANAWYIFDNTAEHAAIENALALSEKMREA
jgi:uncharacterized protein YecE (DUF72 family)